MKMDLRLVVTNSSELQDHGYGEVAKECSTSKYFKDKRKTVVASKALLNSIVQQNAINHEKYCVYIPHLIAMGFDMHLCVVFLKSNKILPMLKKKLKSVLKLLESYQQGEESDCFIKCITLLLFNKLTCACCFPIQSKTFIACIATND